MSKTLSSRAKKRMKMRLLKTKLLKEATALKEADTNGQDSAENDVAEDSADISEAKTLKLMSDEEDDESFDDEDDDDDMQDEFDVDDDGAGDASASVKERVLSEMLPDEMAQLSDDEEVPVDGELPIEKKTKKALKTRNFINKAVVEGDLQMNEEDIKEFHLPTSDEIRLEKQTPLPLNAIHDRIKAIITILSDFKKRRDPERTRKEYMDILKQDLCQYYSYNQFLMSIFVSMFSPHEIVKNYLELEVEDIQVDGSIYDRPLDPPGQRSVYIPPGDTNKESYRLSTFIKFPHDSPVNPRLLAGAGFFYTGYKDRVKCFCCGLCAENWVVGDDVSSSRWHRENCQMMLQGDSGNVPIGSGFFGNFPGSGRSREGQLATEGSASMIASVPMPRRMGDSARDRNTSSTPAGSLIKEPIRTSANPVGLHVRQTARPVQPSRQINDRPIETSQTNDPPAFRLATIPSVNHEQFVRSLDLHREADRLRTFDAWPPSNQTVHPSEMARCGFFYLGNRDLVQCFSCSGVLRNWNNGDSVEREHNSHFPECRMVRGTETRNVPLRENARPAVARPVVLQEPPDPTEEKQRDLLVMFPCLMPASVHMRNEDNRFDTFDDRWPASQVRASPRQIARAGFFFLGDRDRVRCWYCNGGLQNWDPDDEPWTKHAKWFPSCEFLLQRKGPDYVHRIVALFRNLPRPVLRGPFDIPPRNRGGRPPSPPPPIIDPRAEMQRIQVEVNQAMESAVVATALEMGFEDRQIRRAIQRKLEQDGAMFATAAELVESLTSLSEADSVDSTPPMQIEPSEPTAQVTDPVEPSGQSVRATDEPNVESAAAVMEGIATSGEVATSTSMESEISLPEGITPSMEAHIRELQEERKCKICLDKLADVVFVPCDHLCSCTSCAESLRKCPICRNKIAKSYRTYLS